MTVSMETTRESDAGYPEEQAPEVSGEQGGDDQRRGGDPQGGGEHGEGSAPETESGDGKATGNPNT
jgi:hypothetical protein